MTSDSGIYDGDPEDKFKQKLGRGDPEDKYLQQRHKTQSVCPVTIECIMKPSLSRIKYLLPSIDAVQGDHQHQIIRTHHQFIASN